MPSISVFTPSHRPRFLDECCASLRAQTFEDWEWVVLLSAGAFWQAPDDPRIRVLRADSLSGVGAVKRRICELLTGEIFVELDHDDLLASTALAAIAQAFERVPEVGFVYSDWAQVTAAGGRDDTRFDERNGWVYREVTVDGRDVLMVESLEPSPHNLSYIWFAPNHVRAFRRSAYEAVGGYAADRDVLDDQDLMGRLFQLTAFHRIPECLYLQRMHGQNTQVDPRLNPRIQAETVELYERDVQAGAVAWSARRGLATLELMTIPGPAQPGFAAVCGQAGPGVEIVADLRAGKRIPLPDSSVGVIRAVDVLPSVPGKVALFNELYRVLAHGGMLLSLTPSTDGRGAFQDPAAVAFYNENAFWAFTDRAYAERVAGIECRFQVSRLRTYAPSDWHAQHQIPYVQANLIAIKDGPRQGGLLAI